jgi:hypothetical protein
VNNTSVDNSRRASIAANNRCFTSSTLRRGRTKFHAQRIRDVNRTCRSLSADFAGDMLALGARHSKNPRGTADATPDSSTCCLGTLGFPERLGCGKTHILHRSLQAVRRSANGHSGPNWCKVRDQKGHLWVEQRFPKASFFRGPLVVSIAYNRITSSQSG